MVTIYGSNLKTQMKRNYIKYLIKHPYKILSLVILLTSIFIYGIKWLVFDDDFVSLLPENVKSRQVWMNIADEFGESEVIIIAVGIDAAIFYLKGYRPKR